MNRFRLPLLLQGLTFLIPLNIYAIGLGMGSGIQWALLRYQTSYAGVSFITVTHEWGYLFSGMIAGRSALSILAGVCGTCLLMASMGFIIVSYLYNTEKWVKPAAILTIIAGASFLISSLLQYGFFLNGPAGFVIPIGIPLVFFIGWIMFSGYYLMFIPEDDGEDNGRCNTAKTRTSGAPLCSLFNKYQFVFLFILIFLVYSTVSGIRSSGDTFPAAILPYSIIINHTMAGDPFQALFLNDPGLSYSFINRDGHYYSLFPVVTPILVLPLYALQYLILSACSMPLTESSPVLNSIFITGHVASALIATLCCLVFYFTVKKLVSDRVAFISTLILAFATTTWSISSQALWQHGMVELLLILMIWLIIRNEECPSNFNLAGLGILAGLFLFNRPPDAVLLLPILGYVLFLHRNRLHYFLAAGIAGGLPFLCYNYFIFGNVFGGYIKNIALFHLDWQFWTNFLALLISPNRGLLVYSPVLILAIIGFFLLDMIKNRKIALLLKWFGPVILLDVLVYCFFYDWMGGYSFGPRFLTGLLPVLVLYLAVFLEFFKNSKFPAIKKQCISACILLLVIISIIIQVIGVFFFPFILDIDAHPDRMWDLESSQIARSYRDGSGNITSISLILLPPLPNVELFSTGQNQPTLLSTNESEFRNYRTPLSQSGGSFSSI
ncbi:MAG: glycosyltransferase family 39 protein [Methanoregula sp.]